MSRFKATMDNTAKATTVMVCVVVIFPLITMIQIFAKTQQWYVLIPPVVVIAVILAGYYWMPKGYSLENGALKIHLIKGDRTIPLSDIESIESIDLKEKGFGIRTLGSGGFFGYFGKFWYKQLGHISMYATDKSKTLLVTMKEAKPSKKYLVISPDDTAGFMASLKKLRYR